MEKIGSLVPASAGFEEGDQVVVVGGWGDETCRHCHEGNTQICPHGKWPGFGPYGGYSEYVPVPVQYVIKVDKRFGAYPVSHRNQRGACQTTGCQIHPEWITAAANGTFISCRLNLYV